VIGPKAPEGKSAKAATAEGATTGQNYRGGRGGHYQAGRGGFSRPQAPTQMQRAKCYNCAELGHLAKDCPQERADDHEGPPSLSRLGRIKCYNCAGWGHMARDCASEPCGRSGGSRECWRGRYRGGPRGDGQSGGVCVNLVSTDETTQVKTRERGVQYEDGGEQANHHNFNSWEFGVYPIVGTVCTSDTDVSVRTFPLKYVNVTVSGCDFVALEDSGCQIPLVSTRVFSKLCSGAVGNVTLHGFGKGQTVQAPLANVTVCLSDVNCENVCELPIMCAVNDFSSHDYDVILPAAVLCNLQAKAVVSKGLCNVPTVRACCKGQPCVDLTSAD